MALTKFRSWSSREYLSCESRFQTLQRSLESSFNLASRRKSMRRKESLKASGHLGVSQCGERSLDENKDSATWKRNKLSERSAIGPASPVALHTRLPLPSTTTRSTFNAPTWPGVNKSPCAIDQTNANAKKRKALKQYHIMNFAIFGSTLVYFISYPVFGRVRHLIPFPFIRGFITFTEILPTKNSKQTTISLIRIYSPVLLVINITGSRTETTALLLHDLVQLLHDQALVVASYHHDLSSKVVVASI